MLNQSTHVAIVWFFGNEFNVSCDFGNSTWRVEDNCIEMEARRSLCAVIKP